jgi:ElaB/YqjD/DUF883 family membrane-anchored ribosome-binding protein
MSENASYGAGGGEGGSRIGLGEAMMRAKEAGAERFRRTIDTSREVVRADPIKSVLIAAGVGAVIGYLIARRWDR